MLHLRVVIAAIQIALGTQFANAQGHGDTDGNGPCVPGRAFIDNSCLPLPYILKEQVESGAMTVKEWKREMGEWKEYWKKYPEEEIHGCTDKNGFDTGLCVTLPKG